ncbi:hypothetical protein JYU34_010023 [Plutella xylostella]|uniref:Uncharacterized protein n=1 Tax=Plutella xylostella TaxID=51655 RepID=A0ABQ7QHK0_PLUXY|nr:hypothetical protein JYU34_010023 [Plutella xylostella]
MEKAVVLQFLDFFQDFINLCHSENWPDNSTTEEEIKNAFLTSQHIEKCLDKLQKKHLLDSFLTALNDKEDNSDVFIKNCIADPPKSILKKIINSKTKITQMDVGFKIFLQMYSEDKLQRYLTDFIVEAASKETLLKHLGDFSSEKLLKLQSKLLLAELVSCEDPQEPILEMLRNCDQGTTELLVLSLLNQEVKYRETVSKIKDTFLMAISSKSDKIYQKLWKHLFSIEDKDLLELCLEYSDLFKVMSKGLIDCSKLLREQMSAEYFYINLTYSELVLATQKLCQNAILKEDFFAIVSENSSDLSFWENVLL